MKLTPEAMDAAQRLSAAIDGKSRESAWQGRSLTVGVAEVNPRDIVDLCDSLPDDLRAQAIRSGSANALEAMPSIQSVALHVVDVVYLVRQADKLAPKSASPATFEE